MNGTAPVPVPSQLPPDADEWARGFAFGMRDAVAAPLFGCASAEDLQQQLPDLLAHGAALRMRWLTAPAALPPEQAVALMNAWMRPPPPAMLGDLEGRATALLGPEESFLVRRALAMTLTDVAGLAGGVVARIQEEKGPRQLVSIARLLETTAPHDVLALAWLILLLGDVPLPSSDVAHAAAAALIGLTAERLAAAQSVVGREVAARDLPLRGPPADQVHHWLARHPTLAATWIALLGFSLDDPAVEAISLSVRADPEDSGLSMLELGLDVSGDPDDALARIEARALRAGVLGVLGDGQGGVIVLTASRRR